MNFNTYETLDKEIRENMEKRHVFECLYNDALLPQDKSFYKSKIDLIDQKVNAFLQCQRSLMMRG